MTKPKLALAALAFGIVAFGCRSGGGSATNTTNPPSSGSEATPPAGGVAREMPTAPGNSVDGDTIKLGLVASMNGANRPWGVDSKAGALLAVDEANQAGGISGKKIDLIVGDSNSSPEQGKSAAEKLVSQDKVVALLGEVASGITMPMADVGFEKGVPVVAVGATKTELTQKRGNIFRVCYTDAVQGPVMAKFAHDELGLKNIALVTDKTQPYSSGLSDSFRAAFVKLGGTVADEVFYETGNTDFHGILTSLKDKNPDGLFLSGYFPETGPIARQAKEIGLNVKMLGGDGWDSSEILNTGGDAIIGQFFCNHYNNAEKRPEVQSFLAKWKAKYGNLPGTTMGALGYDAAALTIDALKKASALNSKALIEALENEEHFKGVTGDITLKGMNGDPPKRALVVKLAPKDPSISNDNGQRFVKAYEPSDVLK